MKKYKLKDKLVFEWYNEFEQLDKSRKWNWITITLAHIYFEKELDGYMFQFVLLGLGFYFRYNTDKAMRQFEKWENERDWETIFSNQKEFDKATKKKKTK